MKMKFLDNKVLPEVSQAEYLGGILDSKADPKAEIAKRISVAGQCRFQMGNFWKRAKLDTRRKLQVHEALISAKLMYALDTSPLSEAAKEKIDAAFYKGLRQILNMKTTFAQRKLGEPVTNTNERVLEKANEELNALQEEREGERIEEEQEKMKERKKWTEQQKGQA